MMPSMRRMLFRIEVLVIGSLMAAQLVLGLRGCAGV
jgi:hypothetical protein